LKKHVSHEQLDQYKKVRGILFYKGCQKLEVANKLPKKKDCPAFSYHGLLL